MENIWEHSDIVIEGDVEAQQGIRFNIFQLKQTYTGDDARLNIGPKGFTGENMAAVPIGIQKRTVCLSIWQRLIRKLPVIC